MTTANHLINALAAQDQDEADSAFEAAIQERLADFLEVRKVELASTIMDDLQEATSAERQYVRQVAAVGRAFTKDGKKAKRSIHQGELKAHAAKNLKKLGPETVQYHADILKQTRQSLKAQGKMPGLRKEEALDEVLSGGSASNAQLGKNVVANIRRATQALGLKGVNPNMAAQGHKDFAKLVAKNPKAPGYMLLRKLAPAKAAAVQSLTQAGVPLGSALDAHPSEFNQVVQRIKRFK